MNPVSRSDPDDQVFLRQFMAEQRALLRFILRYVPSSADAREGAALWRGVRAGVNGSWRDNYLLGTPGGQTMVGGTRHPVNAYLLRDQKIWGQQVRLRLGVKNLLDLENSDLRKTGFTTMSNGANVYTYSYVMPPQYDATVSVKF